MAFSLLHDYLCLCLSLKGLIVFIAEPAAPLLGLMHETKQSCTHLQWEDINHATAGYSLAFIKGMIEMKRLWRPDLVTSVLDPSL